MFSLGLKNNILIKKECSCSPDVYRLKLILNAPKHQFCISSAIDLKNSRRGTAIIYWYDVCSLSRNTEFYKNALIVRSLRNIWNTAFYYFCLVYTREHS